MNFSLTKYKILLATNWQSSLQYRIELLIWALVEAMPLASMLILWISVYREGNSLAGMNLDSITSYYLFGYLITRFTNTNYEIDFIEQVRTGEISQFFLKPLSVFKYVFFQELAWRLLIFFMVSLPLTLILILLNPNLLSYFTLPKLFYLALLIVNIFLINFLLSYINLGLSFFQNHGQAAVHFKWMLEGFFSGSLLPLALYPDSIARLARLLPFQLRFSVPVEYLLGTLDYASINYFIFFGIAWICFLYLIGSLIWHKALYHFASVGG